MTDISIADVLSPEKGLSPVSGDWLTAARQRPKQVAGLVSRIVRELRDNDEPLTDEHLWAAVAAQASPGWEQARKQLQESQKQLQLLEPLGSIGAAMDAGERSRLEADVNKDLSAFVYFDETLRQDNGLKDKFNVLYQQKHVIEQSLQISREGRDITRKIEKTAPRKAGFLRRVFSFSSKTKTPSTWKPLFARTQPVPEA